MEAPEDKMGDNNEQLQQLQQQAQTEINALKAEAYDIRKNLEGQIAQSNSVLGQLLQAAEVDSPQALFDFIMANKPSEEVVED